MLNVEQYEYMPGPHDAAGVKILLHDRNEFPKVHALGQALSAGVHSFVAIRLISVSETESIVLEGVHTSKIPRDKTVSDARQVFTRAKNLARVRSDPRSPAHLRRWVSTL